MACPTCHRLSRDEALIQAAIEERKEALRAALDPELRDEVAIEEAELAALLQRIVERRAAEPGAGLEPATSALPRRRSAD